MEIGALTRVFLVAGLTLALLGGLGLAIIDLYAWEENKYQAYTPFSPYAMPLRSLVTCGVFGAFQAIVAVGGIVVVCLWWMLLPIVTVIVAAVSALLFLGELVPAAIFISAFSTGSPYVPTSKMNYLEDPEFEKYVQNYADIQSQYSCNGNEEWGTTCPEGHSGSPVGAWWEVWPTDIPRLSVPDSYYWNSSKTNWDKVSLAEADGPYGRVLACIIDFNTSKAATQYPQTVTTSTLLDCERLDLVVVECIGGWSEAKLNAAAKKGCRKFNNDKFEGWDKSKVTDPLEKYINTERDEKVSNVKGSASNLWSCRFLNIVLLVLELFSCVLTVAGIVTAFFYSDQPRSAWRESSSTSSEPETVSYVEEDKQAPPQQTYQPPPQETYQPPPQETYQPPPQEMYQPPPVPAQPPVEQRDQPPPEEPEQQESSSVSESVSSKSSSETS